VANGHPFCSVQGLSFEADEAGANDQIVKDVRATAFSVEDVKLRDQGFPVAFVALPPRGLSAHFETAKRTFREGQAEVVTESEVERWAAHMVDAAAIA
jgi:hypothetical protein